MKRTFAEIGFGNATFLSTEIEDEDGNEHRVPRFIMPEAFYDLYVRLWIGRRSIILSTRDGIKVKLKDRKDLKLLFGIGGSMDQALHL